VRVLLPKTVPIDAEWAERCRRLAPVIQPIQGSTWGGAAASLPGPVERPLSVPPVQTQGRRGAGFVAGAVTAALIGLGVAAGMVLWPEPAKPVVPIAVPAPGPVVAPIPPPPPGQNQGKAPVSGVGGKNEPGQPNMSQPGRIPKRVAPPPPKPAVWSATGAEGFNLKFVDRDGVSYDPGDVPPGTYLVRGVIPGYNQNVEFFKVTVGEGEMVTIKCSAATNICRRG
jgi:hypothetical protein